MGVHYKEQEAKRFRGNHKGNSLSVTRTGAFHRVVQLVTDKDGNTKRVLHYVEKTYKRQPKQVSAI